MGSQDALWVHERSVLPPLTAPTGRGSKLAVGGGVQAGGAGPPRLGCAFPS